MRLFEILERREMLSAAGSRESDATAPALIGAPVLSAFDTADVAAPLLQASSNLRAPPSDSAVSATIFSARAGLWSDPGTWVGNRVPTATDDVLIAHDVTIDQGQVRMLSIFGGTARLAGDLHAYGSVIVYTALVGTQGSINFHVADDRQFTGNVKPGPLTNLPDFHPEDTGLWVMPGGTVDLQGEFVTPWLDAQATGPREALRDGVSQAVAFDSGQAVLASAPVGWRPGDTLLLVNEHGEDVLADLVSVQGQSIVYEQRKASPSDPDFVAHALFAGTQPEVAVYPKIANLSRRLQIVSADVAEGDTNHRAHTLVMAAATATILNVELRDLGPRGKLGRYPMHFHRGGLSESVLEGSSIWQDVTDPGNRFVAIHDVQGVRVANNVAFRARGHGFFMESGPEFDNQVIGNLSVDVTGGEELGGLESPVGSTSHHYWLRGGNTIQGNVAAGNGAPGLLVFSSTAPGSTARIEGMQSFGTKLYGMWSAMDGVVFDNPIAVYSTRAGFGTSPPLHTLVGGAVLSNPVFLLNGLSDGWASQIFVNHSLGNVVNGGVLAGEKALHTHYESALTITGTQIFADALVQSPWSETAVRIDGSRVSVGRVFDKQSIGAAQAPGILRIVDSQVRLAGGAWQANFTADFTASLSVQMPGFSGTPVLVNGIQLSQPAQPSGFIVPPDAAQWGAQTPLRWTVTPVGQVPAAPTVIVESEERWRAEAALGGYPNGFPPGTYVVEIFNAFGTFLQSGYVIVRSGEVSQITFAPGLLPGDVNFDGVVDLFDVGLMSTTWGKVTSSGDANMDRNVDIFDVAVVSANWSVAGPPEDVNHDGKNNLADLTLLAVNIGLTTPNADVNGDGVVGILDLNAMTSSGSAGGGSGLRVASNLAEDAAAALRPAAVDALLAGQADLGAADSVRLGD